MDKTTSYLFRYNVFQNYNISLTNSLILNYLRHYKEQKNHAKAWLVNLYLIVILSIEKTQYVIFNAFMNVGDISLYKLFP